MLKEDFQLDKEICDDIFHILSKEGMKDLCGYELVDSENTNTRIQIYDGKVYCWRTKFGNIARHTKASNEEIGDILVSWIKFMTCERENPSTALAMG